MMKRCQVCMHPNLGEIERELREGVPYRTLSTKHGLNIASISRHLGGHIAKGKDKAFIKIDQTAAGMIVDQVIELKTRAMRILDRAEEAGRNNVAISAIREARATLELIARITGELKTGINITIAPEWINLRMLIVNAVQPFPEAHRALLEAIRDVDTE